MPDDFAARLKALMRQRRVTLKQVADATGKSISAVQKWGAGGDRLLGVFSAGLSQLSMVLFDAVAS